MVWRSGSVGCTSPQGRLHARRTCICILTQVKRHCTWHPAAPSGAHPGEQAGKPAQMFPGNPVLKGYIRPLTCQASPVPPDGLTGVCPACRLFGCAGWKRRFNLQVATTHEEPFWLATRDKPDKFNHWWLSQVYKPQESVVAWGQFTLGFHWIRGYETHHQTMQALVSLISHLGAIGAKSQYGFGIFSYTEAQSIPQSLAIVKQNLINPASSKNLRGNYPSINDFWLLRCDVPRNDADKQFGRLNIVGNESSFTKYKPVLLPVSFDIRYKLPGSIEEGLRQAYRLQHGKMPTRQLFGTLIGSEKDKRASSVFVSHLYKEDDSKPDYQLRVWAFAESKIMGEMQKSLQNIFPNLSCTQMKGSDLLDGVEARV